MGKKDATPPGRVRQPSKAAKQAALEVTEPLLGLNEPAKHPGGRPTKYDPERHIKQVFELCLLGLKDDEIARVFGISVQTLNTWKHQHPKFLESMKEGKEEADGKVARSLYERACGYTMTETVPITDKEGNITGTAEVTKRYPPDTQALRFWLMNRQPHLFRERTITEVMGKDGAPIEVVNGSVTDFAALREKIKAKASA